MVRPMKKCVGTDREMIREVRLMIRRRRNCEREGMEWANGGFTVYLQFAHYRSARDQRKMVKECRYSPCYLPLKIGITPACVEAFKSSALDSSLS